MTGSPDIGTPIPVLSYRHLPLSEADESTASQSAALDRALAQVVPHAGQALVKRLLVAFGLLSIAQFAIAIALICRPLIFTIAIQDDPRSSFVSFLPAIANVTNKTAEGCVWLWERHLARQGTSLVEMEAWGCMLSTDLPATLLNARRLDLWPLVVFLTAIGLTAAATTAVTNAVTPFPGQVTVQRRVVVPSFFAGYPSQVYQMCAPDDGWNCPQSAGSE